MVCRLHIQSAQPLTAGLPLPFQVIWTSNQAVRASGLLHLIYDYRGAKTSSAEPQSRYDQQSNAASSLVLSSTHTLSLTSDT